MQIKEMFEKQIDRDIKGVIKVGQSDEENVYQELDEYVVTKELLKHFRDFFDNYEKGINNNTDKMGVWISGFFGSGKSHFLKILSYLLKNSVVEGKRAIEYFTDGKKIDDPMLIAKMTNSGTISSDVMLFNIDSKGSAKVGSGKEAIVEVFMKVFNEMQGYCGSIPYLAEFERQLDNEGRFEEFKDKFEEIAGAPWEKKRQAFAVIQDKIVKTIVAMDFMSEEAARNWCKNAKGSYDLSIEKFVSLVKEYCEKKGPNHHVIFLVDEIGQYIADDTQLMLNLQTIVEDLGTACRGKAWVIVTSQEDIDSITKTKGNDFSKIQGRFDTRLSLSASNVDEVIRKRILEKNEIAESALKLLYEQKESIIKNLITFTADTADKKLYTDKTDFADCYPFIPYQFNLLGQVLTAVRTHGASGKHLSDQSRSMLALFQESAIRLKDSQEGVLVPFSYFYDPLHKFIDHQHSQVITDAEDNSRLDEFDVELLKVLFMIKYVKEIKANVDNLTTLMISNIDDDRIEIRGKIEESLKKLIRETLVQKNGEIYIFLTNEEQEINNAINNESVEMGEIIGEASTVIFEEIFTDKKYRYSSRYLFPFNQKVDDRYFKGNEAYLKALEDNGLLEKFWELCEKYFGYQSDKLNMDDLAACMLLTYASVALKDTLPAVLKSYILKKKNDVVVFVRNLMDNVLYQDAYDALSEKVDKTLRVVSRIRDELEKDADKAKDKSAQLLDIANCDAFRGLDGILIDWALDQLNDEILDAQIDGMNLAQIAEQRTAKSCHFGSAYKNEYQAIKYAYQMMKAVSVMEVTSDIKEMVADYQKQTYLIDSYYRWFYSAYDCMEDTERFAQVRERIENMYSLDLSVRMRLARLLAGIKKY